MRLRSLPIATGAVVAVLGLGAAGVASAQEDDSGTPDVTVTTDGSGTSDTTVTGDTGDDTTVTEDDGTDDTVVTDDGATTEDGDGCDHAGGGDRGQRPDAGGGTPDTEAPADSGESLTS